MTLDTRDLILVISDKPDPERDSVAASWIAAGGEVLRLGRFWDPPPLDPRRVRLYGADSFCQVLAQKLELDLVSPPDDLLLHLPRTATKRDLRLVRLSDIATLTFPSFVKSSVPKLIRARIYTSPDDLAAEARGLEPETQLLLSEIVSFSAEARAWLLDAQPLSLASYEGTADLADAHLLAAHLASHPAVPSPCVLDLGLTADRGWALIEANAAWGAGLNNCDPTAAASCLAHATRAR